MSKVHDLTLASFLNDGASGINVYFHDCGDLQKAYDKLKPYTSLGSIEKDSSDGAVWLKIKNDDISIIAFL